MANIFSIVSLQIVRALPARNCGLRSAAAAAFTISSSLNTAAAQQPNNSIQRKYLKRQEQQKCIRMNSSDYAVKRSDLNELTRKFNSYYLGGYQTNENKPLFCCGVHIGFIWHKIEKHLTAFPDLFTFTSDGKVLLGEGLPDTDARSLAVDKCLRDLRLKSVDVEELNTLGGWREETYDIRAGTTFTETPLFRMERSATCLFGLRQYGVDLNGYTDHPEKGRCLWMQRRSKTKPTWPGMMDNFVGGGLASGLGVGETAVKEAEEEADVTEELAKTMVSKGTVSFFYETNRGLFPNTEYVFDLHLPSDFVPGNNDGEVDGFELVPMADVLGVLKSSEMKVTSIPVALDFLVRHGVINADNEPDYLDVVGNLHIPIHQIYRC